jgi:hypothetical protein
VVPDPLQPSSIPGDDVSQCKDWQGRVVLQHLIAEQTNVWLGGFHSICREMQGIMYDFFVDQMILMQN